MNEKIKIGVDIGGTKTLFALVKEGEVIDKKKVKTPETKEKLLNVLSKEIEMFKEENLDRKFVGVGVAAVLDKKREKTLKSPNIPYLDNISLKKELEEKINREVKMENDVNCFGLAEAFFGKAKNHKIIFSITLGTGVGGALMFDKKLWTGAWGGATEIGRMVIGHEKLETLGDLASKKFFKDASPKEILERARSGDTKAADKFREYGRNLGIGIANIVNVLDPDIIVLGGGISNAYEYFKDEMKKTAKEIILSSDSRDNLNVVLSDLGEESVAIGATLLE